MSRFREWTSAHIGLGKFASQHLILDVRNTKGQPDKYYKVEIKKLIDRFSKVNKINGSFSERVLIISHKMYPQWKEFILDIKTTNTVT